MNGPYTTTLKLNSIKVLREKLASGILTNDEVLALICEIESVYEELRLEKAKIDKLKHSAEIISEIVWAHLDDSIDIDRLRDEVDIIRHDMVLDSQTDVMRMQKLLARFLHKVKTEGNIAESDELVRDVHRYIHDAGLLITRL